MGGVTPEQGCKETHGQCLTFTVCKVAYAEDVVGIRVMVLFDVGSFLWGVLQLHGHFFQLFVQLFKTGNTKKNININLFKFYWVKQVHYDQKLNRLQLHQVCINHSKTA